MTQLIKIPLSLPQKKEITYFLHCQKCNLLKQGTYVNETYGYIQDRFKKHKLNGRGKGKCLQSGEYRQLMGCNGNVIYYFMCPPETF